MTNFISGLAGGPNSIHMAGTDKSSMPYSPAVCVSCMAMADVMTQGGTKGQSGPALGVESIYTPTTALNPFF